MRRLKKIIRNKYYQIKIIIRNLKFYLFTKISSNSKNLNVFDIPIIIISFNQLFYLKKLIDFLKESGYKNIVIIDNNSTYKPLLDYFETIKNEVKLHLLNENFGHSVFWKINEINQKYTHGYYALTDPDINPYENCPKDFLKHFKNILDKNINISKVGFSLSIDDIPENNENKSKILLWENKFWELENKDGDFIAEIDTTFALYKPIRFSDAENFYKAIRTKKPYIARHGGWYIDHKNLTMEQEFYINTANSSSSWLSKKSNLINFKY